jgi:dTDP-4-dehydrorhamnose 3,5-epimerase
LDITETNLAGVLLIKPKRFEDERGFFSENWNQKTLSEAGLELPTFVQDNHSLSRDVGTLRGLHFQSPPHAQGKLVRCGQGKLFDVAVDIRRGSPTFGDWFGTVLSADNGQHLWIPAGFLHGFVTREPNTEILYKCTDHYAPECDGTVRWDCLDIDWGIENPLLSEKDAAAPSFADFDSPFTWKQTA